MLFGATKFNQNFAWQQNELNVMIYLNTVIDPLEVQCKVQNL